MNTQYDLKQLLGSRSLCLDAYCEDDKKKIYDIEIQIESEGAGVKRARYHSSSMDVENLKEKGKFNQLPETYTIFLTEKDIFNQDKAVYRFDRMEVESHLLLEDEQHILYVNGSYRGKDEIGQLMHDFCQSNPDDMSNQDLANASREYKETKKGEIVMCEIVDEIVNEAVEKAKVKIYIEANRENGITDPQELIRRLLNKFDFLTEEDARKYVLH